MEKVEGSPPRLELEGMCNWIVELIIELPRDPVE
jgi:hypothetical protein